MKTLFFSQVRDRTIPTLEKVLEDLKSTLQDLCQTYRIEDLSHLKYWTIVVNHTEINKNGKTYRRVQLKAFYGQEGKTKSKTIKSWSETKAPRHLQSLVALYRACLYLSRACDYLFSLKYL